jgi:hypothetical protein
MEIENAHTFLTTKKGESLSLGILMSHEEQRLFLHSHDIESPAVCLMINGNACDCYEGRITDISSMPLSGCVDAIEALDRTLSNPEDGFYVSLGLYGGPNTQVVSSPVFLSSSSRQTASKTRDKVTLVLPLVLNDLPRAALLLSSLRMTSAKAIAELIVLTRPLEQDVLCGALQGMVSQFEIQYPLRCLPESSLLPPNSKYPGYGVQMALKLLVAKLVQTDFYITLDADLLCLHPMLFTYVLAPTKYWSASKTGTYKRGVYHFEEMSVHPLWWESSAGVLNISTAILQAWAMKDEKFGSETSNVGFGATPAVLSTFGSLLTVGEITRQLYCASLQLSYSQCLKQFLTVEMMPTISTSMEQQSMTVPGDSLLSFPNFPSSLWLNEHIDKWISLLGYPPQGYLWSEYTLYRLALAKNQVFHQLHVSEEMSSHPGPQMFLHCENVWFMHQLPWNAQRAYANTSCLFSVVQSTLNVPASDILRLMR